LIFLLPREARVLIRIWSERQDFLYRSWTKAIASAVSIMRVSFGFSRWGTVFETQYSRRKSYESVPQGTSVRLDIEQNKLVRVVVRAGLGSSLLQGA
jgi:hypothetical protein